MEGTFFPRDLPTTKHLAFYGGAFPTTELNGVFYRTPSVNAVCDAVEAGGYERRSAEQTVALIAFMAATAKAQAEATKAAQRAGIEAGHGLRTLAEAELGLRRQRRHAEFGWVIEGRP